MSTPVVVTTDARTDIDDARDWYENQQPGRGDSFIDEVRDQLDKIGQNPQQYGRVNRNTRAAPLPTSKFIVYYRTEPNRVVVVAVQHAAADPRKWKRRK
jgi:plasmid stabilization system protein ParE